MQVNEVGTIEKSPELSSALDYSFLREEGLKHIEKYSKDLWTDYNIHDPGITLLELLSYAITDVARRTTFSIEDILAEKASPQIPRKEQFFTASEILTSVPVTINDFRKVMIDRPGIKNAWIKTVVQDKPAVYINKKKERLQYEMEEDLEQLKIRGLYKISLELEEDPAAGELNHYTETAPVDKADAEKGDIIINLPHWSDWRKSLYPDHEIRSIEFKDLSRSGRFKLDGSVQIRTAGHQILRPFSIRTTIGSIDRNIIKSRLEEEKIPDQYARKIQRALEVVNDLMAALHQNRNLCEDFTKPEGLKIEEVGVCTGINVKSDASLSAVLAEIYYQLEQFIAPPIHFYSLREMLERNIATEDIFNGPVLQHGFIDDTELEQSELRTVIYVSDIVKLIMKVDGVESINEISLASMFEGQIAVRDAEWCLKIPDGRAPRFSAELSKITLYKDEIPYFANDEEVQELLDEKKGSEREKKLSSAASYDIAVPKGADRDITAYTPLQNDLPNTFGVGEQGLDEPQPALRKAQVKQLRAFLLFFDQLLANYLAQLSRSRELLSFSSDTKKTCYTLGLMEAPKDEEFISARDHQFADQELKGLGVLLTDFRDYLKDHADTPNDLSDPENYASIWEEYKSLTAGDAVRKDHYMVHLNEIIEERGDFYERRNRFLDHLLARFGEQFTDYAVLMHSLLGEDSSGKLVQDKIRFMKELPELSSARPKAMNYKNSGEIWDTDNVAVVLKRLSRLLGMDNYNRRTLTCENVMKFFSRYKDVTGKWRFRFSHPDAGVLLRSSTGYETVEMLEEAKDNVRKWAGSRSSYRLLISSDNRYFFNLLDDAGDILGTGRLFTERKDRERALNFLMNKFGICNKEGFYLVEHMLLRPEKEGGPLLPVCLDGEKRKCPGFRDPYSFRISIIIPWWPKRFRQMEFRKYVERTIRKELPAHIHAKICWADEEGIENFEKAWRKWLKAKADPKTGDISSEVEELIRSMAAIRSVYPVSTLHDCRESGNERPTLLDKSIIGTFKPE